MTDPIASWGQTIVLRPVRTRFAMGFACTVHDYAGQHVADVRAILKGWQRWDRFFGHGTPICGYDLDVMAINESAPILTFSRVRQRGWGNRPERYEVRRNGEVVGALQQPKPTSLFGGTRFLALESGGHDVGRTGRGANSREVAIADTTGRTIATITTAYRPTTSYTLAMPRVYDPTVRTLCLTATIAEYFQERTANGGALNALSKWLPCI